MFYLRSDNYGINKILFDGWYIGKTYKVNDETYATCSNNISSCKAYISYSRAQNACTNLNERISNYVFTVEEV